MFFLFSLLIRFFFLLRGKCVNTEIQWIVSSHSFYSFLVTFFRILNDEIQ